MNNVESRNEKQNRKDRLNWERIEEAKVQVDWLSWSNNEYPDPVVAGRR